MDSRSDRLGRQRSGPPLLAGLESSHQQRTLMEDFSDCCFLESHAGTEGINGGSRRQSGLNRRRPERRTSTCGGREGGREGVKDTAHQAGRPAAPHLPGSISEACVRVKGQGHGS